jgi:uncharacterized glyoxalase superfamily protein PhnB
MKFAELVPMLRSDKLAETIDFYTRVLGFTCGERNEEWGWAALFRDNVEIMVAKPNAHTTFDKPMFTGSFYIRTDNVDELWETLKEKAKIVYEIENFEWQMREFAIHDNNGYVIQFGQDLSEIAV